MSTSKQAVTARRGRPGYDQQAVLQIAVDVFNRHGYEATSMGILAENLGISKSAIYHHVPSKEDLLRLALDEALGGLEGVWVDSQSKDGSAAQRLSFVIKAILRVLATRLPYVTLLLRLRGNTEMEQAALSRRRDFDHRLADLVRIAQADGTVRGDIDPRLVSRLIFGTINSVVEWYKPGGVLSVDELITNVYQIIARGVYSDGED